jgi:predicted nucleotidyltransferase
LLKIVAFLDDNDRRAKDLLDIRSMLASYEEDSERIFSDEVLDAKLADFSLANAFLLGMDLRILRPHGKDSALREWGLHLASRGGAGFTSSVAAGELSLGAAEPRQQ